MLEERSVATLHVLFQQDGGRNTVALKSLCHESVADRVIRFEEMHMAHSVLKVVVSLGEFLVILLLEVA